MTKSNVYNKKTNLISKLTERSCTPIRGAEERKAYRRTKAVKKHTAILVALTIFAVIFMSSVIYSFAKEPANTAAESISVTVQSGDSLWSIANEYFPGEDPRDVISEIREMNNIADFTIYAGETILLPADI